MKMNKKGFTLIELLAVIAVLAIVTVIATQAILPYIKDSGKNAFATEASSLVQSSKKAVDMYNLNKLNIENDNNSCIKDNIMCFTVEKLIDLGLYKADKNIYVGKIELNIENSRNISTALYLQKENEFNIVSSYKTDFSKNKDEIKSGGFSSNTSEYTTCSCDEFGSSESTPTFTFYLGGNNNPEYTNRKDISTYLSWSYKNIANYCLAEENDSSSCEWKNVSGSSITGNYTLTGEDGIKKIYAFIKDASGNIKPSISDIIQLDTDVPAVTGEAIFNNTENAKIIITSSKDGVYCINTSDVLNDMNNCVNSTNRILSNQTILSDTVETEGDYYIHVKDSVGNIGISGKIYISLSSENIGNHILSNPTNGLNTTLEGGMYRYQGTSVDNYICFGTSVKSTCLGNPDAYMYRIIGITEDGKIKALKNYALESTMQWFSSDSSNITWPNSTIYSNINGSSFLSNASYMPSGWSDKIETTIWKYGNTTITNTTADALYNLENSFEDTTNAKVGLMYAYDYYYAYQSGGVNCSSQGFRDICKTSWMYLSNCDSGAPDVNGIEWTMSYYGYRSGAKNYGAIRILKAGYISSYSLNMSHSVRPVFFIQNDIQFVGGTGTASDPFIIS